MYEPVEYEQVEKQKKQKKQKSDFIINRELLMKLAPLLSLILLCVFFSVGSPYFFSIENLMTIALQTAVIGIMAGWSDLCHHHRRH